MLDRVAVVLGPRFGANPDHLLDPRNEPGAAADLPAHGAELEMGVRVHEARKKRAADALRRHPGVTREQIGGGADVDDGAAIVDDDGPVANDVPVARDHGIGVQSAHARFLTKAM